MYNPQKRGMNNILAKYYPECSTLAEAFNLERKKLNELAKADKVHRGRSQRARF
jgi:hypothetical protein